MATTNKTGLILPFNMADPEERAAMFDSKSQDDVTMVIFLPIHCDPYCYGSLRLCRGDWDGWKWFEEDWDLSQLANALREAAVQWIVKSPFPEMQCVVIPSSEDDLGLLDSDWEPNEQLQKDWAIDGMLHLQLGFCRGTPDDDAQSHPNPAVYFAMATYDAMYAASGMINPKDQSPIHESEDHSADFRRIVNGTYMDGLGVWCRDLVDLRNEVMVKIRALLYSDDPDVEWKRFCDAGMVHFLDYLKIWTPPIS